MACFEWDGQGDPDDSKQVIFSKPYGAVNDLEDMLIYFTPTYADYMKTRKMLNLVLFMVPVGVDIEHASTIREAKAMGARQVWHSSAGSP